MPQGGRGAAPRRAAEWENQSVERNWERAHPFAEVPIEELERRVRAFFPSARVLLAAPQTGGLRNSNYRLTVAHAPSPVALRIYVADRSACAREAAVIAEVDGRVPVARVLAKDAISQPPFAIMEWLDGESLEDVLRDCDVATALELAADCGTALAAIHRTRFHVPGFLEVRGGRLSIELPMPAWTPTVLDALEGTAGKRLGSELADRVRFAAESSFHEIEQIWREAVLAHGDFKPANLLVRQDAGRWRICGVLDWEFACAATPLLDFAIFLRDERARPAGFGAAFANAYRSAGGVLPTGWRRLTRITDLLNLLQLLEWSGEAASADLCRLVEHSMNAVES